MRIRPLLFLLFSLSLSLRWQSMNHMIHRLHLYHSVHQVCFLGETVRKWCAFQKDDVQIKMHQTQRVAFTWLVRCELCARDSLREKERGRGRGREFFSSSSFFVSRRCFSILLIWVDHEQVNPLLHFTCGPSVSTSSSSSHLSKYRAMCLGWAHMSGVWERTKVRSNTFYLLLSFFSSLSLLCVRLTRSHLESSVSCIYSSKVLVNAGDACCLLLSLIFVPDYHLIFCLSLSLAFSLSPFVLHFTCLSHIFTLNCSFISRSLVDHLFFLSLVSFLLHHRGRVKGKRLRKENRQRKWSVEETQLVLVLFHSLSLSLLFCLSPAYLSSWVEE